MFNLNGWNEQMFILDRPTRREEARKRLKERRRRRSWPPGARRWTSTTWTKTSWSTSRRQRTSCLSEGILFWKDVFPPQGQDQRAARVDVPAGVREVRPHGETEEAEVRGEAPPPLTRRRQSSILHIFTIFLKRNLNSSKDCFFYAEIHVFKRFSWFNGAKILPFFFFLSFLS